MLPISVQERRFEEVMSVMTTDGVIARWRYDTLQGERPTIAGVAKQKARFTLTNDGDVDATVKLQDSAGNVAADDNLVTTPPTAFAASFADIGGTAITLKAKTTQILDVVLNPAKSYIQLYGSAPTGVVLRIQGTMSADVDVLSVTPRKGGA